MTKSEAAEYHRLYGRPHKGLTDAQVSQLRIVAYRAWVERPDDEERDRAMCDIEVEACWRELPYPMSEIMQTVDDDDVQHCAGISTTKKNALIARAEALLAAAEKRNAPASIAEARKIIADLRRAGSGQDN
jgi:hypothetical protein